MIITLPQANIEYPEKTADSELLLIGGGRPPARQWLQAAAAGRPIWCIDHGIDACRSAGLRPARLIGDSDSAQPEAWKWGESLGIPIDRFAPEKDLTDTQLALRKIKAGGCNAFLLLTGALGGRFDHALSTVYSLLGSGLSGCLADEQETLFYLRAGETLSLEAKKLPKAISLLPLGADCQGVTIRGVHWPLTDAALQQDWPYALSNELTAPDRRLQVTLASGCLGVYLCWEEA